MAIGRRAARTVAALAAASALTVWLPVGSAHAAIKGSAQCVTRSDRVECAVIDSEPAASWHTAYQRSFRNTIGQTAPLTCYEPPSSSLPATYPGLTDELTAWVFTNVEASAGVELTHRWSADGGSVEPVAVPSGWKYSCEFGTSTYSVHGHTTRYWSNGGVTRTDWTFMAPADGQRWQVFKDRLG